MKKILPEKLKVPLPLVLFILFVAGVWLLVFILEIKIKTGGQNLDRVHLQGDLCFSVPEGCHGFKSEKDNKLSAFYCENGMVAKLRSDIKPYESIAQGLEVKEWKLEGHSKISLFQFGGTNINLLAILENREQVLQVIEPTFSDPITSSNWEKLFKGMEISICADLK